MEKLFHGHHSNAVLKTALVPIVMCGGRRGRGTNLLARETLRPVVEKQCRGSEASLLFSPYCQNHLWSTCTNIIIITPTLFPTQRWSVPRTMVWACAARCRSPQP